MNKTIVVFGSSTGTCESIAEKIASRLGAEVMNVQDLTAAIVSRHNSFLSHRKQKKRIFSSLTRIFYLYLHHIIN